MKQLSYVLAALATIAVGVPTIASAGVLLPSSSDAFSGDCQEEDGGK